MPAEVWRNQLTGALAAASSGIVTFALSVEAVAELRDMLGDVCDAPGSCCDHYAPCHLAIS